MMKIQQTNYQNHYLNDLAGKHETEKKDTCLQTNSNDSRPASISISEDGQTALRKKLRESGFATEYCDAESLPSAKSNEVAWEHYTSMRDIESLTFKDGNYNLEDVMESTMNIYEIEYDNILKAHETGDRKVSYELTGDRTISLEEDLAGLDEAYQMLLANLEGYITCQQTNKAFGHSSGMKDFYGHSQNSEKNSEDYNFFDDEYRDTAISMMKQAREEFLSAFHTNKYRKGIGAQLVVKIMNNNTDFCRKTKALFS